jgi:hypothetical protein
MQDCSDRSRLAARADKEYPRLRNDEAIRRFCESV